MNCNKNTVNKILPRESTIDGYTIKYSDGTTKEIQEGTLIYIPKDADISIETNTKNELYIKGFMAYAISVDGINFDAIKLVENALALIKGDKKDE